MYSNGKITAPVSLNDVQHVTGNSSTDLGTLCKVPNIKMWAKYKPVIFGNPNTLAALNNQTKTWNPNASVANQWWKATNGDYGLTYSAAMVSVSAGTTTAMKNALSSLALQVNGNSITTGNASIDAGEGWVKANRFYLDGSRYLYVSGSTLYYYNGSTTKQVAFTN